MGPRKLSIQEGGRTPSMVSIHDSLRTTSNVSDAVKGGYNFSFRSAESSDAPANSGGNMLIEAGGRNWSKPPVGSVSPGSLSAGAGGVGGRSPGTTSTGAQYKKKASIASTATPSKSNAKKSNNSNNKSPAASKEKDAVRRALQGDDGDGDLGGDKNDQEEDEEEDGYAVLRKRQQLGGKAKMYSPSGGGDQNVSPASRRNNNNKSGHDGASNMSSEYSEGGAIRATQALPSSAISQESNSNNGDNSDNSGSDNDDYESLGGSSASSMSSNAKRTKEIQKRPIMLYMIALIAVPVLFLTIYQGISVGTSQAMLNFMRAKEGPMVRMLELQEDLQAEMLLGSKLIGHRLAYQISGESDEVPSWAPDIIKTETDRVNVLFANTKSSLRALLLEVSSGKGEIPQFHERAVRLPEFLSKAEIAANRNNGREYRNLLIYVMTELTVMIAILQTDSRAQLFSVELIDMQLLTRIEEYFVKSFSLYLELELSVNESTSYFLDAASAATGNSNNTSNNNNNNNGAARTAEDYTANCLDFSAALNRMEAYVDYLVVGSGNVEVASVASSFINEGFSVHRAAYTPFLTCSFDNDTRWGNPTELETRYTAERQKMFKTLRHLFDDIVNNKDVQNSAITEGMKLLAAVVCCVIGVVIVIYIQKMERKELFSIINHSESLATAVRRFVPKNQLRMMGVRSVLQVEPGFSTEVANTLVSSGIMSFESIAENMSRTELFDWLQMYVARMTYVVQQSKGYIDGIRGDRILSVFAQATNGVNAAIMMQQEADHMNVDLVATKETILIKCSTGVHTGVVVAGVFGDDSRLTCTMVAPDVNLCSRLEGLTQIYKNRIILSQQVYDQIDPSLFELRALGLIDGFPSCVYDLYQADDPNLKAFKHMTQEDFEKAVLLHCDDGGDEDDDDEAVEDENDNENQNNNNNSTNRKTDDVDGTKKLIIKRKREAQRIYEEIKTKAIQMNLTDSAVSRKLIEVMEELSELEEQLHHPQEEKPQQQQYSHETVGIGDNNYPSFIDDGVGFANSVKNNIRRGSRTNSNNKIGTQQQQQQQQYYPQQQASRSYPVSAQHVVSENNTKSNSSNNNPHVVVSGNDDDDNVFVDTKNPFGINGGDKNNNNRQSPNNHGDGDYHQASSPSGKTTKVVRPSSMWGGVSD